MTDSAECRITIGGKHIYTGNESSKWLTCACGKKVANPTRAGSGPIREGRDDS